MASSVWVVLVASADEEAGGFYGAGWLVENHPEIFAGAGLLINEGGGVFEVRGTLPGGGAITMSVAFADVDGDGDVDLAIGNAGTANQLLINDGTGKFTFRPLPARQQRTPSPPAST